MQCWWRGRIHVLRGLSRRNPRSRVDYWPLSRWRRGARGCTVWSSKQDEQFRHVGGHLVDCALKCRDAGLVIGGG
ncbi:hypothetical protein CDL15_Pgr012349 [Punica granatum]|uniref:Uncharacterized protein n=1 Tax=Punica granatum TaxID=22663 RepID=A0A218X606_PUNGR|nr:hypothetical protein CDL15_Pgr012349 [Punica granatum]